MISTPFLKTATQEYVVPKSMPTTIPKPVAKEETEEVSSVTNVK